MHAENLRAALFHVVFATKHRAPWIRPELAHELYPFVGAIVGDQGGVLLAIGYQ